MLYGGFFVWSSLDPSLHAPLRLERYRKVRADTELAGVNPLIGMPLASRSRTVSSTRGIRVRSDSICIVVEHRYDYGR